MKDLETQGGVWVCTLPCVRTCALVCAHAWGGAGGARREGAAGTPFSTSALRVDGEVCGQADVCAFAGNAFSVSSWKLGMFLFVGRSEISVQCF